MKYRILGKNLEVSSVGFGCMGLSHAYGVALEKQEAVRRIHEAVESGYTFFDTAEVYLGKYADGSVAVNEEVVGEALRPFRDKVVIATKCGLRRENGRLVADGRPEQIRQSIEGSLKRMKLDAIDLYYQHRQDPEVEPETVAETMGQLIKEGKIRSWGISNSSAEYIRRADQVCKVTVVQERYSMMARKNEALFPMLEELDIGLVAYSPLANGFLTSGKKRTTDYYNKELDFRSKMPQYTAEGIEKARQLITLIETMAKEKGATPAQISLAWMLCKKPWIVPIPGTSKTERMKENAQASEVMLTPEEIQAVDTALETMDMPVFGQ